jgi:hypothetical protein
MENLKKRQSTCDVAALNSDRLGVVFRVLELKDSMALSQAEFADNREC